MAYLSPPTPSSSSPLPQPPQNDPLLMPPPPPPQHQHPPPSSAPSAASRRLPPPCWSHDETVALIDSYRDKWYALRRGNLRAVHWQEVSDAVAIRCPQADPSKTSVQCRHKMEKLRKRYRTEKQRPYPHLWQYFDLMDQLERGPLPISVAPPIPMTKTQEFVGDDSDEDVDYTNKIGQLNKGIKIDARSSRDRKTDEFEELIDGFYRDGGRRGEFGDGYSKGGPKLSKSVQRNDGNARFSQDSWFRKGKSSFGINGDEMVEEDEVEEEEEEEEEEEAEEEEESGGMLFQLAAEMRDFAERFVKMEKKKIEMMRETERFRMEMENKRMEMILVAQQKTVDLINRAFGSQKKMKVAQDA